MAVTGISELCHDRLVTTHHSNVITDPVKKYSNGYLCMYSFLTSLRFSFFCFVKIKHEIFSQGPFCTFILLHSKQMGGLAGFNGSTG